MLAAAQQEATASAQPPALQDAIAALAAALQAREGAALAQSVLALQALLDLPTPREAQPPEQPPKPEDLKPGSVHYGRDRRSS